MDLAFMSFTVCYIYLCLWRQLKLKLSIIPAEWQISHVLGFCTGVRFTTDRDREERKGKKNLSEELKRLEPVLVNLFTRLYAG